MEGFPKFDATQTLPDVPYHRFAELIGLKGVFCNDPEQVIPAWEEALASDRPCVIEFKTDPEVPPLPAHISFEQAKHFMRTMLKGDPDEAAMIRGAARQVLADVLPRNKE